MTTTPGQRVRLSRRDLGMTQQQLADKSGVSRSYIGNLERDSTTNVGRDIAVKLAKGLGVAPDYRNSPYIPTPSGLGYKGLPEGRRR